MYTLLLNDTNELITTVKERIMQRSKLVDNLHFLVEPNYKGIDMSDFTVTLEYILPVSREYHTDTLVKSEGLYKNQYLEYKLPFDTPLTKEAGKIELQLTFTRLTLDADGNNIQQVRKISPTTVTILPISAWSDIIPDSALSALDQRLLMVDAMINAANEFNEYLDETKADNITFDEETRTLQLTANGKAIGDKVILNCNCSGISEIHIDTDGNLIAVYNDGTQEVVGKTGSDCAGIYIPSMESDIMTFTLADKATDKVLSFDLNESNNWHEVSESTSTSDYIWEELI
jgi:hypothetical protein